MAAPDIKRLPISEFRERGYLHEVNRLVLHPLGLALEVSTFAEPVRRVELNEEQVALILKLLAFHTESEAGIVDAFQRAPRYAPGEEALGGVWDCQDDPEGVEYGPDLLSPEKARAVVGEMMDRRGPRIKALGYVIQPIRDERVLTTNYTDPEAEAPPRKQQVPGIGEVEFEQ